jgi:mono/diheme cytochrome c family protein
MIRSRLAILAAVAALAASGSAVADPLADRGAAVANLAGCAACHNAPDGRVFAGGTVLQTPFGPLATPNITSDTATGIGGWTEADFTRALREGLDPDGRPLYPAMPYTHYTEMTDDDLAALWAFVQTVPAIENSVEVNRLRFPFDVRESLWVWRALYFTEGRFQPDAAKDAAWNRGAYIIDALAHCGECHTPRDALGGLDQSRSLQGAQIEEWYAPDISGGPNSVITGWDVARLEAFLSGNDGLNHVAVGSMRDVVADLSRADPADVHAIAVYLKDQPADASPDPALHARAMTAAQRAEAEALFAGECVTCHGANGEGAPGVAASLVGSGAVLAAEPSNVVSVLLEGIGPSATYGAMPSFRDALSDADIAALANYVRTSWGNSAPANATPAFVAGLRNVTAADPAAIAGALCPAVATDAVDAATREAINQLAAAASFDAAAVSPVVAAYDAAHPDATQTTRLTTLGGLYCQALARDGAARATVAAGQLRFMDAVIAASAQ